jgi:hypothetical protein
LPVSCHPSRTSEHSSVGAAKRRESVGSIDPGKAISLTKPSFARNEPYILHVLCAVRSRLSCFGAGHDRVDWRVGKTALSVFARANASLCAVADSAHRPSRRTKRAATGCPKPRCPIARDFGTCLIEPNTLLQPLRGSPPGLRLKSRQRPP